MALLGTLISGANAATPTGGTVSSASPTASWSGGPFVTSNPSGLCLVGDPACDRYNLTIEAPGGGFSVEITTTPSSEGDDYDLYVHDASGARVGSSASESGAEKVVLANPAAGTYSVRVLAWKVLPGGTYQGAATMKVASTDPGPTPDPTSVKWSYDPTAAQATVEVPLRVVMVGFQPGELNETALVGEIPDYQRPGVLIPRGQSSSGDAFPLFGAETLVNHGRNYYNSSTPFTVPYEYKWKRQVIYAPDAFAAGLFAAMKANSTTGEFAKSGNRQYLEAYNANRGVYRGAGNVVAPNSPVRFVNGEAIEDWISANSATYLGFDAPARGKGPGSNPGYTVYVLNTWDSALAKQHLQPEHEYHVWKINRTDPDTSDFDGIDWARVWGGRYRFMMVDLGAAPNPYEAETWGNRNRSVNGSANYDPPLWEYRAGAPRPVTLVNLGEGIEQAVTPGERWDTDQLNRVIGRTVGQAASFRFMHSYLYEPQPATGQYWFSDNVWHDANAELPWASDLSRLYNQDVVLTGLRTLTPYLTFAGDVRFAYLGQGGADNTADQAMLDQAKRDGDDIAGAPGVAMHTDTAMDYIDAQPRLFRGGACYTTVPAINVVAEKHYAWALAIAAGIATNRNGVPWGYLGSVNDVFKSPESDRDQSMTFAHPSIGSGAFTYTAIHEASHYLGLAHPHDSIGATRNADGSPKYYDGFTWAFNSTASPTTYSHTELVYSILDQENIARGHAAYYLKWADESLADGGQAYFDAGVTSVGLLPAAAARLRKRAIDQMELAETLFARFDFVKATFAAQKAFRAAAAYRDLARGLAPGTTELGYGTKKEGAESCQSAKEQTQK
ncbi:MAG: PPC domain-containing protein [Gaiellaceae bacterium]